MIANADIKIEKTAHSRVSEYDVNNVPFGKCFSDHMFIAEYADGKWSKSYITPYQDMPMSYAMSALHYGQAIFEGMKAYKSESGEVSIFRPIDNFNRLNKSAIRMAMPEVPEEIFMGGLLELLKLDEAWVPTSETGSLYIRPFLIATDEAIGVKPSETYKFVIITCPAGKYYSEPIKVLIETNYIRAVQGGVGFVKAAGNYGRSMFPTKLAQQKGYQQVIWTDGATRKISIQEVLVAYAKGEIKEAFGVGTAATIAQIMGIGYQETYMELPAVADRKFSNKVDETLRGIRKGKIEDKMGWMYKVK
jgi:branched-chain amino acid aminotransferase